MSTQLALYKHIELVFKTSLAISAIQHIASEEEEKKMAFSRLSFAASLIVFSSLIISSVAYYGDQTNPETGKLIPVAVEGVIMCKSGGKSYPIQGNIVSFVTKRNWSSYNKVV